MWPAGLVTFTDERAPERLSQLALQLSGGVTTDPAFTTQEVVDYFLPNGLQYTQDYERAIQAFKWEVPQNYFDRGEWNLGWDTVPAQMASLLYHIIRLPEFQLS